MDNTTARDLAAEERERLFEDRWSAYGANTGIDKISERLSPEALRQYELFRPYDDAFLEKLTPDITVASWKADAILFEQLIDPVGNSGTLLDGRQKRLSLGQEVFDRIAEPLDRASVNYSCH